MIKHKFKKSIFCFFLLLSCVLDFFTYYFNKYKILESNPLIVNGFGVWVLVIIKFGLNIWLCYCIFHQDNTKRPKNTDFRSFFIISICLILIIIQLFGTYSNLKAYSINENKLNSIKQNETLMQKLNASEETVTEKYIEMLEDSYTETELKAFYYKAIFTIYLYPILFCLASFYLWKKIGSGAI